MNSKTAVILSLAFALGCGGTLGTRSEPAKDLGYTKSARHPSSSDTGMPALSQHAPVHAEPSADRPPPLSKPAPSERIYVSNDDSASLASPQRAIWALQNFESLSSSEIRTHELLNYFHFSTTAPVGDDLFGLNASAVQTGHQVTVALAIQGATPPRAPMDLTLIVDRSGSMETEDRIGYIRRGLHTMIDQLQPGDRVDLLTFGDDVTTEIVAWEMGTSPRSAIDAEIDAIRPGGRTNISGALYEGYTLATGDDRQVGVTRNHRVMLLTDANVNLGQIDPVAIGKIGAAFEDSGVRLTVVGVGRDVRDDVLDELSEQGKGAYVFVGSQPVADRVFGDGFAALTQTIAHDVRISVDLPESLRMQRFYGEEMSTDPDDVQPVNFYAGNSQLVLQDLQYTGKSDPADAIGVRISYRDAATGEPREQVWTYTVAELLDRDPYNVHKAQALIAWGDVLFEYAESGRACGPTADAFWTRKFAVDDAELDFVGGLIQQQSCGRPLPPEIRVDYKVNIDSDVAVHQVRMTCPSFIQHAAVSESDRVARFEKVPAGDCTVGVTWDEIALTENVHISPEGGNARCRVRHGTMTCD